MNWGEYNLTRMRGCLHPQITGDYRFWIASDNSSELWLSTDADPSKARKIASIARFGWVGPHEWSRFPSQRSEPILLKAGETYYIEALQEQTTEASHLSVAWQGPSLGGSAISVIGGRYLTPWSEDHSSTWAATNGILREYWTNYSAGDLTGLSGARPFESALTIKEVRVRIHGLGELPKPDRIALNQRLPAENNYRWVQAEGVVKFKAADENAAFLELSEGQALVQVRVLHWSPEMSRNSSNAVIRVEGVCEGVYDQKEMLVPGLIWASTENSISFIDAMTTNAATSARGRPDQPMTTTNPAMQGFYGTRGVVTFNDRVFDRDFIFVQEEDNAAVLVALGNRSFKNQLKVGQGVDLGGALEPGKYVPVITPLIVAELGWHSMPVPIIQPLGLPFSGNREGKWNELEGVVHSVNSNGTLSIVGNDGPAYLWVGQTPINSLTRYVDAKLRARGVLLLTMLDAPVLLIPSRNFVDVEEAAPEDPYGTPRRPIADLLPKAMESSWSHRARVVGEITYRDAQSFFVQDASGGIRVRTSEQPRINVRETVEVLAFPTLSGSVCTLTEALVRPAKSIEHVRSKDLDLSEALSSKQSGTLVYVSAMLLARKTNGINQVLELQEQQRVFVATLATGRGNLPDMAPGSRLRVTGVCDDETAASPPVREKPPRAQFLTSLNILLRSPQDVAVLSGPSWWTWRKTATLVGMLLTILVVTLLWVHLLHRRLERQQAAQLVFSRRVLERLEDERRRIAVNLHDSLGQTLLVIKNHAILAIQRPPEEQGLRHRLDEISGATSQAIEEVRRITHGLRPYQLDRLGLTQALRASVSRASENSSILFASRVEDIDGLFDKDAEIHVYRIVQEAITNVVKHSAATEATVVIKKRTTVVSLSIRDNGRGFNPAKPSSQPHDLDLGYGLSGIAERVRILGGTLAIESRPGEGASLTAEVPFPILKI
jgi:signal transduction histidine kinase